MRPRRTLHHRFVTRMLVVAGFLLFTLLIVGVVVARVLLGSGGGLLGRAYQINNVNAIDICQEESLDIGVDLPQNPVSLKDRFRNTIRFRNSCMRHMDSTDSRGALGAHCYIGGQCQAGLICNVAAGICDFSRDQQECPYRSRQACEAVNPSCQYIPEVFNGQGCYYPTFDGVQIEDVTPDGREQEIESYLFRCFLSSDCSYLTSVWVPNDQVAATVCAHLTPYSTDKLITFQFSGLESVQQTNQQCLVQQGLTTTYPETSTALWENSTLNSEYSPQDLFFDSFCSTRDDVGNRTCLYQERLHSDPFAAVISHRNTQRVINHNAAIVECVQNSNDQLQLSVVEYCQQTEHCRPQSATNVECAQVELN